MSIVFFPQMSDIIHCALQNGSFILFHVPKSIQSNWHECNLPLELWNRDFQCDSLILMRMKIVVWSMFWACITNSNVWSSFNIDHIATKRTSLQDSKVPMSTGFNSLMLQTSLFTNYNINYVFSNIDFTICMRWFTGNAFTYYKC